MRPEAANRLQQAQRVVWVELGRIVLALKREIAINDLVVAQKVEAVLPVVVGERGALKDVKLDRTRRAEGTRCSLS